MEVLVVDNGHNVECFLRVVLEIQDAMWDKCLSLTMGPNLFSYSCQVLTDEIRDEFDVICPNHPNTVNGFEAGLAQLIS